MGNERAYLERRYDQETAAALAARCPEARAAHREMARRYAMRLDCRMPASSDMWIRSDLLSVSSSQAKGAAVRARAAAASELVD